MLKKSRAAKEFHPAGHSCCCLLQAANGSCVILATQVFAMSQPFTLKADSRDVHKKHMYVLCKLKLGPQIICFRWWQSRFLGGMGWRGRDRGVKQRLTALVSQKTTCFATYLSKTNWAVVQHIFVVFICIIFIILRWVQPKLQQVGILRESSSVWKWRARNIKGLLVCLSVY